MVTEINRENNKGAYNREDTFIVAVDAEGRTKVFRNREFEYVRDENCHIVARANTLEDAENAEKHYLERNTCYFVIAIRVGTMLKLKVQKFVGVIETVPIGTSAICKNHRQIKRVVTFIKLRNMLETGAFKEREKAQRFFFTRRNENEKEIARSNVASA